MYQYKAKWIGTDISANQIEQAKLLAAEKGMDIEFFTCPAEEVNYPDNTFDVITICQCIWYLDAKVIAKNFARKLKPPNWSSFGDTVHPVLVPDEFNAYFDMAFRKEQRVNVSYKTLHFHSLTHQKWSGVTGLWDHFATKNIIVIIIYFRLGD